jgi:hypothetical protein
MLASWRGVLWLALIENKEGKPILTQGIQGYLPKQMVFRQILGNEMILAR